MDNKGVEKTTLYIF